MVLRQAVRSDIPAIQRVRHAVRENRLVSTVIADEDVREAIEDSGRGWVVEAAGEIVGFAIGNARTGNVWALFVDPEHEQRGHGRALHDAMVAWLWAQGLERLWLSTDPATRAQSFYEAAGWQRIGTTAHGEIEYEMRRPRSATGAAGSTLRAAGLYFGLVFAAGFALGCVRVPLLVPLLGMRWAELVEMPAMFTAIYLAAGYVAARCRLSPRAGERWKVGALALLFLLAAELLLAVVLAGRSVGEYLASRDPVSGSVYLVGLGAFAAMPWLRAAGRQGRGEPKSSPQS